VAKIRWTVGARRDLHEIVTHIAEDSPAYAINFAERIALAIDRLETFPKLGRIVPEYQDANVRELIVGNYRIVYKIRGSRIGIAAIAHASRELLKKLPYAPWDLG
jgi:toxin ParE1/3/4